MLRKRVVTVLLFNNGVLFRSRRFKPDYRYTHNFIDTWSIDEIVALDITRPGGGKREHFYAMIDYLASKCFVPIAAGGGVRSGDDFRTLLRAGADKVVINTKAIDEPEFISEMARSYGSQCVVVSIDARKCEGGHYEVYSCFGSRSTGMEPSQWARQVQEMGAGEIFLTSIEKDGSLEGYDNELNLSVCDSVDVPVLVCGGAGSWQNFVDGFEKGHASAVCTTNIYHFTEDSIRSAKTFLVKAGINVRN